MSRLARRVEPTPSLGTKPRPCMADQGSKPTRKYKTVETSDAATGIAALSKVTDHGNETKLMKSTKADSTLGRLAHACSEFGDYFMSFQRRCFKSGRSSDCEGNPTLREAQRDYREMLRSQNSHYIGRSYT